MRKHFISMTYFFYSKLKKKFDKMTRTFESNEYMVSSEINKMGALKISYGSSN